jgi:hypothetical protein
VCFLIYYLPAAFVFTFIGMNAGLYQTPVSLNRLMRSPISSRTRWKNAHFSSSVPSAFESQPMVFPLLSFADIVLV